MWVKGKLGGAIRGTAHLRLGEGVGHPHRHEVLRHQPRLGSTLPDIVDSERLFQEAAEGKRRPQDLSASPAETPVDLDHGLTAIETGFIPAIKLAGGGGSPRVGRILYEYKYIHNSVIPNAGKSKIEPDRPLNSPIATDGR
jgi:hypothetical protein